MRRLAEHGPEAPTEMRLGDVSHPGDGADIEGLGIGPVHRVAGAQQAPIEVFDFAAHEATLRQDGRRGVPRRMPAERADLTSRSRCPLSIDA